MTDTTLLEKVLKEIENEFGSDFDDFQNAFLALNENQRNATIYLLNNGEKSITEMSSDLGIAPGILEGELDELRQGLVVTYDEKNAVFGCPDTGDFSLWHGLLEFIDECLDDIGFEEDIGADEILQDIMKL